MQSCSRRPLPPPLSVRSLRIAASSHFSDFCHYDDLTSQNSPFTNDILKRNFR